MTEHLEAPNADLVETIARALAPASWETIDQRRAAHEAIGGSFKRVASKTTQQANDVIAALGLTEERCVLILRGSDGEMERTVWDSIDDARYQWPDREYVAGVHWVTPWQEGQE